MSGLQACLQATFSKDTATRQSAEAQLKAGGDQPGFAIQLVGIMQVRPSILSLSRVGPREAPALSSNIAHMVPTAARPPRSRAGARDVVGRESSAAAGGHYV